MNFGYTVGKCNNVFIKCLDKSAPLETRKVSKAAAPWLNDDLRLIMKQRDDTRSKLSRDRSNTALNLQYVKEKKFVKSRIAVSKKEYYASKFNDSRGNSSAIWNLIKELVPNKKKDSDAQKFDDVLVKAEEFNNFFANVGKTTYNLTQQILPSSYSSSSDLCTTKITCNSMKFRPQPVDINTIILTVKGLNETRSVGSDGISLKFVKDSLCIIAFYLTFIINTSIVTGVFPQDWKNAYVIPLFKKGDFNDVNNFRPISILPVLSKILEKIVFNQLLSFLEDNNYLSNCQHGFRPKLSTETALTIITDAIYTNIDNKKISLLTLCDLSKAFDSVSHDILLRKCSNLNIDCFWLKSYLHNRTQAVKLRNVMSTKVTVSYGVPQGSILGPLLFNIYVNDMYKYISNCILVQYADDTQFLHSGSVQNLSNIIKDTEATLIKVQDYFLKNGLMVNPNKTQCIFFGSKQLLSHVPNDISVYFNGNCISPSNNVKNLGLHMDRYLHFDVHINEITKKVIGMLSYLSRISMNFDKPSRTIVVQSLVLSVINYCMRIWATTNTTLINRVQKLQNFAARVSVGGLRKHDHVSPAFEELGWLNIKQKHLLDLNIAMYKSVNGLYPTWLHFFPTVQNTTNSTTRQQSNLTVLRTKTDTGARAFYINGPRKWNSLPQHVTTANTLSGFRHRLIKHIL